MDMTEVYTEILQPREIPAMDLFKGYRNFHASYRVYERYFPGSYFSVLDLCGLETKVVDHIRKADWAYPIVAEYKREVVREEKRRFKVIQSIFVLKAGDRGMVWEFEDDDIRIIYDPSDEALAKKMIKRLSRFKKKRDVRQHIHMVVPVDGDLLTQPIPVKPIDLDINSLYNDDFRPFHDNCIDRLSSENKALFLMHGTPGTGKSTYIKYLLGRIGKKVIYLSTSVAANLDSPTFSRFLMDQARDAVLVIEDAELLLTSRESHGSNSAISMILNLSDGLLADSLAVKMICTFNIDVRKLDRALLRKGRLTGIYEFKPLVAQKADDLLRNLGRGQEANGRALSLAEIFHMDEENHEEIAMNRPSIGFRTAS